MSLDEKLIYQFNVFYSDVKHNVTKKEIIKI